jgi:hypothetical protein
MMRFVSMAILFLAVLVVFLAMSSATIPAGQYSISPVSQERFKQLKAPLTAFAKSHGSAGVTFSDASDTFAIYCKKAPLIVLSNGPGATYMLVFLEHDRRAPGTGAAVREVLVNMRVSGRVSFRPGAQRVAPVEAFLLRYRDGIDLDARCSATSPQGEAQDTR